MKNVLLVDDDKVFNFLNAKVVEHTGLAEIMDTVFNGKQAIDLLNNYSLGSKALPDIIFLDLNMPVMNGFEFLEEFRKIELPGKDRVRVVVLSSSVNPKEIEKARQLGADHYLSKPLKKESLLDVMR